MCCACFACQAVQALDDDKDRVVDEVCFAPSWVYAQHYRRFKAIDTVMTAIRIAVIRTYHGGHRDTRDVLCQVSAFDDSPEPTIKGKKRRQRQGEARQQFSDGTYRRCTRRDLMRAMPDLRMIRVMY